MESFIITPHHPLGGETMRRLVCLVLVTAIFGSLCFVNGNPVAVSPIFSGYIGSDTKWTLDQSPIQLTGDVTISPGVTLTIEPGVYVDLGFYSIIVEGTLNSKGTSQNQIVITTSINKELASNGLYAYNPLPENIRFEYGNKDSTIEYTNITETFLLNAGTATITESSLQSALIYNGTYLISNSKINGVSIGGVTSRAEVTLTNNKITSLNLSGGNSTIINNEIDRFSINNVGGTRTVKNNIIKDIYITAGSPTIINNTILGTTSVTDENAVGYVPIPFFATFAYNTFYGQVNCYGTSFSYDFNSTTGAILETHGGNISNGTLILTNNEFRLASNETIISVSGIHANISNNNIVGNYNINENAKMNLTDDKPPSGQVGINVGANLLNSSISINGNYISHCKIGINILPGIATVSNNTLTNNYCGIAVNSKLKPLLHPYGTTNPPPIHITTDIQIQKNTVSNNTLGIQCFPYQTPANLTNNDIYENTQYNFVLSCNNATNVAYNYWGTTDYNTISQSIYEGKNDHSLGTATFSPILSGSYAQSPSTLSFQSPTANAALIIVAVIMGICIAIGIIVVFKRKRKKDQ